MSAMPWVEDEARRALLVRALEDIGECEVPPSSNRSDKIDEWNRRAGAPLASYWCASWVTAVLEDCQLAVPKVGRASCDNLVSWAMKNDKWFRNMPHTQYPRVFPGDLIVYTNGKTLSNGNLDAFHVGMIFRVNPYLLSIEGNAAFSGFSNNGEAVVLKRVDLTKAYGFIRTI